MSIFSKLANAFKTNNKKVIGYLPANESILVHPYPYYKKLYKSLYINSFSLIFSTIKLSIKLFILCTYKSLVDIYFINLPNPIA